MDMNYVDELMKEIKECDLELKFAHIEYDIADPDMIDAMSYKIKYLTEKYQSLLRRLKAEVFQNSLSKKPKTLSEKILELLK